MTVKLIQNKKEQDDLLEEIKHWRTGRVSISIGSIKTFTVNHMNVTAGKKNENQRKNNLAFKYLVDIFVARLWLSTKFLFLSVFCGFCLMTMYKPLVDQSVLQAAAEKCERPACSSWRS